MVVLKTFASSPNGEKFFGKRLGCDTRRALTSSRPLPRFAGKLFTPSLKHLVRVGFERQRHGDEAVHTEVAGLTIRRADGKLRKRLSQVSFHVDVLQHALSFF